MKSNIMLIVAAVVIIAGCTSSQPAEDNEVDEPQVTPIENDTTNDTSQSSGDQENTVITHTSSGFNPQTVTIETGETVTWRSETGNMWVASDQHPSHTQYSGSSRTEHCQNGDQTSAAFDQCSSGEQFSFTFEKKGEWSYHNHENSFQGGTVIVE